MSAQTPQTDFLGNCMACGKGKPYYPCPAGCGADEEIDRLKALCEELRADSVRYRFIRDGLWKVAQQKMVDTLGVFSGNFPTGLDAWMDKLIADEAALNKAQKDI